MKVKNYNQYELTIAGGSVDDYLLLEQLVSCSKDDKLLLMLTGYGTKKELPGVLHLEFGFKDKGKFTVKQRFMRLFHAVLDLFRR